MAKPLFDSTEVHVASLAEQCMVVAKRTVSKALLNTDALKQVLFAIDAGEELAEHSAPYVATVHVLDGRIRFAVDGDVHSMCAGDWIVMPPNAPHSVIADAPSRFLLTLVKERSA